ncbi:MAG: amidase [Acidobacteriota bacterium]
MRLRIVQPTDRRIGWSLSTIGYDATGHNPHERDFKLSELTDFSAHELARLIRDRACSSREVVEAHLERIERVDPSLNAIITLDPMARHRAMTADDALSSDHEIGPLHGVPITIKDGFATAGLRTTFGLPWYGRRLDSHVPDTDAPAVAALRRAGAIILGKTNLPFGSYDWQTNNPVTGRTNHPRDVDRTPGGSSGGSAAAVAAGLSALDLASDVAGSIRVPAHFCGVCAMRPSTGSVSTNGMMPPGHPQSLRHALVAGPIARNVADLRLAFDVLAPHTHATSPVRNLHDLKVAFSPTLSDTPVARAITEAIADCARKLTAAGCQVDEAAPNVDFIAAQRTWGLVHGFEFAAGLPLGLGREPLKRLFQIGLVRLVFGAGEYSRALARGYVASPASYFRALSQRQQMLRAFDDFFSKWDLWVLPVAGVTAFTHRRTGAKLDVDGARVAYSAPFGVFNTGSALAGTPCVVLPVGNDEAGLPIGIQVHGRHGTDLRLLALAGEIEAIIGCGAPTMESPRQNGGSPDVDRHPNQ